VKNYNLLKITLCTFALVFVLNSCSKKNDEAIMPIDEAIMPIPIIEETKMTQVTIKTSLGDIQLELDVEKAPITVENFVSIANSGYYTDTIFHRVINGFMVQGGGLTADMGNKSSGTAPIQNEANNSLSNDRGTIAMARTMEPHSATSQFFINHKDNGFLNHTGENPQGWGYAVFGKVTEGMDVVDAIADVATGSSGGHQDVPLEVINIESVTISE
jgi:peptidyl-prolyl cis-trans isomerase B (cyclophilin B)